MVYLIILGVFSRLIPHPANMTAVGAVALYAGARLNSQKAIIVTMAVMLVSDMVLGAHSLMWATYGSLFLAVCVGKWIGQSVHTGRLIGGILTASVVFFVITNFAVWLTTPLYPKTVSGLISCYIMAIPFFRNSLAGDLFYGYVFFYGYASVFDGAGFFRRQLRTAAAGHFRKLTK